MFETGLFILLLSIITYCVLEEAMALMPDRGAIFCPCEHFFHLVQKKKNTHTLCNNITGLFPPRLCPLCVTDSFGLHPEQFARLSRCVLKHKSTVK